MASLKRQEPQEVVLRVRMTLPQLQARIKGSCGLPADSYDLSYIDEEGDECVVASQEELAEAMASLTPPTPEPVILYVRPKCGTLWGGRAELSVGRLSVEQDDSSGCTSALSAPSEINTETRRSLISEFLQDSTVQEQLIPLGQTILKAAQDVSLANEDNQALVARALAQHQPVAENKFIHHMMQKDLPDPVDGFIGMLRAEPHLIETVRLWLPFAQRLLPLILQNTLTVPREVLQLSSTGATDNACVRHHGTRCSQCAMFPIVGVRFECLHCSAFNLCETCEAKGQHPPEHMMLKRRLPEDTTPELLQHDGSSRTASTDKSERQPPWRRGHGARRSFGGGWRDRGPHGGKT